MRVYEKEGTKRKVEEKREGKEKIDGQKGMDVIVQGAHCFFVLYPVQGKGSDILYISRYPPVTCVQQVSYHHLPVFLVVYFGSRMRITI